MYRAIRYAVGTVIAVAGLSFTSLSAYANARGEFERTLHVNGAVDLQVETGSGTIEVTTGGSNSNEVRIVGHISANDFFGDNVEERVKRLENNPPIQQSGNDIRIGHIDDPELKHNISVSYELVVPANTKLRASSGSGSETISGISGPLEANSGSGSLDISGIGSEVRAHTGSGSIKINGAKGSIYVRAGSGSIHATDVAGGFDGQTGSGHITLEQSASGSVRAETGSGGLELHNLHGSLQAQAGSGNIKAEGEATGEWNVHTGSGSVQLRLPQNASFDLNAHTGSGSINLSHPVTVQGTVGRKEVRGKAGGGGVPVEVQTGSGNIEIE